MFCNDSAIFYDVIISLQMREMAEAPHPAMNLPTMMIQTAVAPAMTIQPIKLITRDTRRLFLRPTMSMNFPESDNTNTMKRPPPISLLTTTNILGSHFNNDHLLKSATILWFRGKMYVHRFGYGFAI